MAKSSSGWNNNRFSDGFINIDDCYPFITYLPVCAG